MLSNSIIGSSSQASHYFMGHDNYYTKGDETAKERSWWYGKGAASLNLSGQVDEKTFSDLLKGKMPDGEQLGLKINDEIKHRPGFDLTFSVPKSVSIAALLGDDPRILEAIQKASDKALNLVERSCAQARITKKGKTVYENTNNLVVAKFLHDLSREADPQLHMHCVVMNMTQRSDSKWRSLASQMGDYSIEATREVNGFIERVRHHEHDFGIAFDAELAFELKKLGYNIVKPEGNQNKKSAFEIEGISKETIEAYSRRSKQIERYMKEYGFSGAKAAAVATIKTRQAKQNFSRENVESLWKNITESKGIDAFGEAKNCVKDAINNIELQKKEKEVKGEKSEKLYNPFHPETPNHENSSLNQPNFKIPDQQMPTGIHHEVNQKAVQYAVSYLSETHIVLKEMDILNIALRYGIGEGVNIKGILNAINELKKSGELITLENTLKESSKNSYASDNLFTTKKQIEYEREILSLTQTKAKNAKPLISIEKIEAYLSHPSADGLSTEQKQAMKVIFSNTNKLGILDGSQNTGKTHLIKPMMELARAGGYQTVLLTSSKAQNEDLKSALERNKKPDNLMAWLKSLFAKDQYATVSGFLNNPYKYIDASPFIKRKAIALIDKAELISAKQWHDLSVLAKKTNLHIVAIGDQKSLQTFQAGTPYTQMLEHGAVSVVLTTNYHSKNKDLQEALSDSLSKNIGRAFEKVKDCIFSVENREDRLNIIAERYAVLSEKERENTLLLMPSKAQCEEMNSIVRDSLKKNNALEKTGIFTEVLVPKSFTDAEYSNARNYQKGQWVRFNDDYLSLKVQKGDYLKIISIISKQNIVLLENQKGQRIHWETTKTGGRSGNVEVFESKTHELVVGETLHWRRNDKMLGFHNGQRLRITHIHGDKVILKTDNDKIQTISLKDLTSRHFDYGYAFTPYQKNHVKPESIIAYQASFSRQSHQRLFYKTLGQAQKNAWIYTENREGLLKNLQQHTGDKVTAIEVLLGKENANKINEVVMLEKAVLEALLKAKNSSQTILKENTPEEAAKNAVQYAIAHLAEREAAFEHKQVMTVALKFALGNAGIEEIQQSVLEAEKKGDLIKGIYSETGTRWTTREAIDMEREILTLASSNKILSQIASNEKIETYIKEIKPKTEHANAIQEITKNTSAVLNIQGYAGVGKTTLLKYIEPILKEEKFELLCLAPTHPAVKELKARGLTAQTVESFLTQNRSKITQNISEAMRDIPESKKNHQLIIAVDESSMLSNRRMRDFLRIAENIEARIWIIGDKQQHSAIESGKPATILERAGVKTLYLTDIERQKNPTLLKAVKETYQGDFAKAFETLENHMIEIGKVVVKESKDTNKKPFTIDVREKRLAAIRDAYINLDPKERAQTLILTFGNEDRMLANHLIREGLFKNNELSGNEITASILSSKDMTAVEKSNASNYKIGDSLRFRLPNKMLGIEKNDYLTVTRIHSENNVLMLSKPDGTTIAFQPKSQTSPLEVYQSEERKLQVGDYIRWTRSDKETGFLSPEVLRVEKIEDNINSKETKLKLQPVKASSEGWSLDGVPISIDAANKHNQHWDYAYVMTGFSAQGRTVKNVLINAESYRKNLTNVSSFLVGITRVVQNLTIYTDDKDNLLKKIQENSKEKTSALEVTGELQKIGKSTQRKTHVQEKSEKQIENNIAYYSKIKHKTKSLDATDITRALHENAESVVEKIMGEPKERTGQQYRYGTKHGSLIVTIKGEKQGFWYDFQTGEGGNLLQLIAKQSGLDIKNDFQKVLEESARLLGSPESFMKENYHKKIQKESVKNSIEKLTEAQQKSIKYAQKLARESKAVKGTLAEQYLREHRGIHLDKFPEVIRFHPAIYSGRNKGIYPALLAVAKDEHGKVKAVQAIYLDEKTAQKANLEVAKQTWGVSKLGATVNLGDNHKKDAPVFIAEGPETGLSLYAALGKSNVRVTLGKSNFKNIDTTMPQKNIVLCLDNDEKPEEEKISVKEFAEKFSELNKNIWIAKPELVKDYNDILKKQGFSAIQKNIEDAVKHQDFIQSNLHAQTLKSEILKTIEYQQQKTHEVDSVNANRYLRESSVNSEHFAETMKTDINHAVDKVASQIKQAENENTKTLNNSLAVHGDVLHKNIGKSQKISDEIKGSENKKMPEKHREIQKEIEL